MGEMRLVLGWLVVLAACYSPSVREGATCASNGDCPAELRCDPSTNTCLLEPGGLSVDAACPAGFVFDGTGCVDVDECATAAADCSSDAACTNVVGSFSCACNAGFTGDGRTCGRVCSSVLIFDDCTAPDADCITIPEALFADNAAQGLGIQVKYGGVSDEVAFRNLFDAGGFELVIFEVSLSAIDAATADRIASWVNGGGKAIVSYWDLDNATTGLTIRTALGVETVGELTTPPDLHRDPASPVDFFDKLEQLGSPIAFTNPMVDDGDQLKLGVGGGFIAARHTSPTGGGAIAVTRNDRVITLGFVPIGLVFQGPRDADADGKPDVTELYTNLIGQLCGF